MSHDRATKHLADLLTGDTTIAMLMTMIDGRHRARPLTCIEVDGDVLSFLVDREVDWVEAIAEGRATTLVTVADSGSNTYLSLEGHASVIVEPAELHRLWTPVASAWFDDADDPRLAVLAFTATSGEWWDGPGNLVSKSIAMLRAFVMADDGPLGHHGGIATGP